ncbi:MAG: hypothetical protein A3D92_10015 [Bacteroidetes bacterium RIFCSPHIGHO2_02_FULL_44_7]|nr:MAG: hypothetical protein A3D92_10015 [Bacteroidetes bacterium RIFCSPHIGHO2_02_FULL_44_7]
MKVLFLFPILHLFVSLNSAFSQDTTVSRQQMYEDFDVLFEHIKTTNPYLDIKKELYSYSILDTIASFRAEIENCTSFRDFHFLTKKVMNTCLDGHAAMTTPVDYPPTELYLPLVYQQGEYRIKRSFTYRSVHFPAGSKLVAINGNPSIHEEVARQVPYRYLMRWDNALQQFYSELFFLSDFYIHQGHIRLDFEINNALLSTDFQFHEAVEFEASQNRNDPPRVDYLEAEKILYLRVPTMDWSARKFYRKEINKCAKGKEIEKVVIDVRNNYGGSSLVGRNIFRALLPSPMTFHIRLYGNDPTNISKKYKKMHGFDSHHPLDTLHELNDLQLYRYIDKKEAIQPYSNSIRHSGPIYILSNEHLYSAGGAILMFANHSATDRIFSIGTPTGWFLGEFSDPIHFTLPHSKLQFQIAPSMSLTDVRDRSNVMLDSYDTVIYPSISDYNNYYEQGGTLYAPDFLLKADPYFKPILGD